VSKSSNQKEGTHMSDSHFIITPAMLLQEYKLKPCCTDERDCTTWHHDEWVNREQVWSIRGECWVWKPIPKVVEAKSKMVTTDDILDSWDLEAAMHLRDDKETAAWLKSMNNWTDDEIDGLLSR
jgi:hypothetical protein